MSALGDFDPGQIVYDKFTTFQAATTAPTTLAGTPVLSVYKDASTTQSTAGVTLTVDFDSVTGFNHYAVDTSADATFYSAGASFTVVITTGTVNSVSVIGAVVGNFSLGKAFAANGGLDQGTAQSVTGTTLVMRSAANFGDNVLAGAWVEVISASTGASQGRTVLSNVGSTDTITVDPWTITPTGTIVYKLWPSPPGPATAPDVNVKTINSQTATAAAGVTFPTSIASPTNITSGTLTTVTNLTNAPTSGDLTATMKASVTTAVPTATQNADALLNRDMSAVSDTNARSPLNALRFLRNLWSISGTTLTVKKEDDSTTAWTSTVTPAPGAAPISGNDPA